MLHGVIQVDHANHIVPALITTIEGYPMAGKKRAPARRNAAKAAPKLRAVGDKQTKTQILQSICEDTGMTRKDITSVFDSLGNLVSRHMMKRGSGEFSVPNVGIKIRRVRKPATKSRKAMNPFTGEPMVVKAKPARNVVKVTALKALKESIA